MRGTVFVQSKGHSDHGGADTDSSGTRAWRAGRLLAIRKRWPARLGEGIHAPDVDAFGDFDGGLRVLADLHTRRGRDVIRERDSVVEGKGGAVRVEFGGGGVIKE